MSVPSTRSTGSPQVIRVTAANEVFRHLERLKKSQNTRRRFGEFFVEGVKAITQARQQRWPVRSLVYAAGRPRSSWARETLDAMPGAKRIELSARLMERLSDKHEPVPEVYLRLNPGDFAPHNVLVRPDGGVCAIDFEYACWEGPAAVPAGFLAAEQSEGLTGAQSDAFLRGYHAHRHVPDAAFERYDRLRILAEASWVLVNLSLMTPAHVARKRFAGDFDLDAHLTDRRLRLERRLTRVEALAGAVAR